MTVSGDTEERSVGGYRLLGIIGEGGMGVVHLAEAQDGRLQGRHVAMKVLRPHVVGDAEGRDRLAREVSSLRRVSSPRVAEVLDADPYGPIPYVVTRYVPGPPLHEQVRSTGPLGEDDLHVFALGLAEALSDVHAAGVLHRDVKPANVLLEDGAPVLIDFGLARVADDARLTATGWLLGTPGYLAPEVIEGREPGTDADVFSWAATVVFAGTGRPPAGRGPAMAVMDRVRRAENDLSGVPASLLPLLTACLDPDPGNRPSLGRVRAALQPRDDDEPVTRVVPAFAADPVDPPTRVLPASSDPRPAARPPQSEKFDEPPSARTRRGPRALATLGLCLFCAMGVALAPYVGAAVLAAVVVVLRFCSITGQRHRTRQLLRGRPRWYDLPVSTASLPAYLLLSLFGTVVLLLWGLAFGCAAAALGFLLDLPVRSGLVLVGVVLVAALWWGPGARRVRRTTRWLTGPPTRTTPGALATALVGLVLAGLLVVALFAQGPFWVPATHAPWSSGFLHDVVSKL
ncbi:MAG: serine/threonine-protein kinase [Marmoricola sp.]